MGLIGNLTGGLIGTSDAEKAAKSGKKLSRQMTAQNIADFEKYFGLTEKEFKPYVDAGKTAIAELVNNRWNDPAAPELALFAYPNPERPDLDPFSAFGGAKPELQEFRFDPSAMEKNPAFQWRYDKGLEAANRALATNRALTSGNRLQALTEYGQGEASQEYAAEYARQAQANQMNNQTLLDRFGIDRTMFLDENQRKTLENQRRGLEYGMDTERYGREFDRSRYNTGIQTQQYGMEADRFRSVLARLTGQATSGERAITNLAGIRAGTVGNIAGARGQNAANIMSANLIPVQEKQNYISGLMGIAGAAAGGAALSSGGGTFMQSMKSWAGPNKL